jgi:hypothetical protein
MDQVMRIGQSEPRMRRGETELCPGQFKRTLLVKSWTGERKNGKILALSVGLGRGQQGKT